MNQSTKKYWRNRTFCIAVTVGAIFVLCSLVINYYAGTYATKVESNSVTDILLDNLPVVNTYFIFSNSFVMFGGFVLIVLLLDPKRIPFVLKSVALFIVIRALFVNMTHLAPFPHQVNIHQNPDALLRYVAFGGDLFFSGHTGLPYLFALMFWENKTLRYTFIAASITAAAAVLLGHLHYTIDVFAAFFITYGIFHVAQRFFSKDYRFFLHGL